LSIHVLYYANLVELYRKLMNTAGLFPFILVCRELVYVVGTLTNGTEFVTPPNLKGGLADRFWYVLESKGSGGHSGAQEVVGVDNGGTGSSAVFPNGPANRPAIYRTQTG
jgi:hypothetical protein